MQPNAGQGRKQDSKARFFWNSFCRRELHGVLASDGVFDTWRGWWAQQWEPQYSGVLSSQRNLRPELSRDQPEQHQAGQLLHKGKHQPLDGQTRYEVTIRKQFGRALLWFDGGWGRPDDPDARGLPLSVSSFVVHRIFGPYSSLGLRNQSFDSFSLPRNLGRTSTADACMRRLDLALYRGAQRAMLG
jgi:hypothetical protein